LLAGWSETMTLRNPWLRRGRRALATPLTALLLACVLVVLAAWPLWSGAAPQAEPATLDYHLAARALAPGVWVVEGENDDFSVANGCNIINTGFIATGAGVVVVNTGPSRLYGEQLRALIGRTTREPVVQVLHLNLHPDYFLGDQAFADLPRLATPATRSGMARVAADYENNMYRLCGDWMKGTQALVPDQDVPAAALQSGNWTVGQRHFALRELRGHTDSDLVLVDRASGVAFVGGLVFAQRIPTTPNAHVPDWLKSLDTLQALQLSTVVPSHGPVHADGSGLDGTRRYLRWLDGAFRRAAGEGLEMNELLRAPVPEEFRHWAAFQTEYVRNVAHLYPVYERAALQPARPLGH
jgi:quinoprotein relay system zinc metallohydrolase 1